MRGMAHYAGLRAVRGLYILFGVSLGSFVLSELAPGDFYAEARLNPQISLDALVRMKSEHHLDQPLISKYGYWLESVVRGEWGFSLSYNMPVKRLLWWRLLNTLLLTVTATVLAWVVGVPAGIWLATGGRAVQRLLARGALALLVATPEVLLVLIFQLIAVRSRYLPVGGMFSSEWPQTKLWNRAQDVVLHLALPVTVLTLSAVPAITMHAASAIAEVLDAPFILGARANGIPRRRLLWRHALPAAAHPLIASLGLSVGTLLSASVLVENAMGWPGLGRLMLEATLERDVHVVISIVMLSAVFLIAGSFVSDLLLYSVDPRIRRE
jgi:peptide/nickel transport system permease protein